jgi:hypothetical protein
VRQQPIEVIARQRGEQLIVQGKTEVREGYSQCDILPGRSGPIYRRDGWTLREGDPRKARV